MRLGCNYRAHPDACQRRALAKAFGYARVVWNDCLRDRKGAHPAGLPYVKSAEPSRLRITQANRGGRPATVPAGPGHRLRELLQLGQGQTARPEGRAAPVQVEEGHPAVDPPHHQRLLPPGRRHGVRGQRRQLKVRWSRRLPAAPTSLTTKDSSGRYFLSFVVDTGPDMLPPWTPTPGSTSACPRSRSTPTGRRSTLRVSCAGPGRTQAPSAGVVPQPGQGPHQGRTPARPRGGLPPGLAPPRHPHRSFAAAKRCTCRTSRCTWKTSRCPVSGAPGSPSPCTTRDGPRSSACWSTRRSSTAERSPRWTGPSRPRRSARPADSATGPSLSASGPPRPGVDVRPVRHRARPRPQRGPQRPVRRTPYRRHRRGGDAERLWSAGKTGTPARTAW